MPLPTPCCPLRKAKNHFGSHFMIRMKWLPTPDESLARREKRRE